MDVTVDELRSRLRQGKVYGAEPVEQAHRAADGLIALAQREGITHVIFGPSGRSRWEIAWNGSALNRFLEEVRDAAVQIVPLERQGRG